MYTGLLTVKIDGFLDNPNFISSIDIVIINDTKFEVSLQDGRDFIEIPWCVDRTTLSTIVANIVIKAPNNKKWYINIEGSGVSINKWQGTGSASIEVQPDGTENLTEESIWVGGLQFYDEDTDEQIKYIDIYQMKCQSYDFGVWIEKNNDILSMEYGRYRVCTENNILDNLQIQFQSIIDSQFPIIFTISKGNWCSSWIPVPDYQEFHNPTFVPSHFEISSQGCEYSADADGLHGIFRFHFIEQ